VTLARHLEKSGYFAEATTMHTCALRAARQAGDRAAEAEMLISLGVIDWRQGRYPQATRHQRQALALCRQTGDGTVKAYILVCLGDVDQRQGRYPQATRHYQQALALFRQTGARADEACALASCFLLARSRPAAGIRRPSVIARAPRRLRRHRP
jgi:tetratricopeptide (TPR) repeat protein